MQQVSFLLPGSFIRSWIANMLVSRVWCKRMLSWNGLGGFKRCYLAAERASWSTENDAHDQVEEIEQVCSVAIVRAIAASKPFGEKG